MSQAIIRVVAAAGLCLALAIAPAAPAEAGGKGDLNCDDFSSQAAAQSNLDNNPSDPNGLDEDGDGIACESNPCPCSTGGGGGGGGGGPGGGGAPPPPPPPPPDPVKTEKLCGKFVGISDSKVCLKATTQSGKLRKVEDFRFRGLPSTCRDGQKVKFAGKRPKIDGDGKKFRSRRLNVLGNFSGVNAKAAGVLKGGGKVRGEVRIRAGNTADAPCDTRTESSR